MTQAAFQDRLDREIAYFEDHYKQEADAGITPLSDFDKARYTAPPANTIYPREFYYHLLSPLEGKKTLEIACGNGIDASICAHNGADHHAYDISENSVRLVRKRAQVNGVADRVSLETTGIFSEAFRGETFDAIMGYAALHHIPMEGLAEQVYERLNPGGVAVFAEPVVNSKALHAIRKCVPYYFWEPTEDEVPLNDQQITDFSQVFDRSVRREFQLVSRIWPAFKQNWPVTVALHKLDSFLLKVPLMRRFATVVVFGLYRDR